MARLPPDKEIRLWNWARGLLRKAQTEAVNPLKVRNAAIALVLLGTLARRADLRALRCGDFHPSTTSRAVWETVKLWLVYKETIHEPTEDAAPLFCGRPGKHMSASTLRNIWKQVLRDAGVRAAAALERKGK